MLLIDSLHFHPQRKVCGQSCCRDSCPVNMRMILDFSTLCHVALPNMAFVMEIISKLSLLWATENPFSFCICCTLVVSHNEDQLHLPHPPVTTNRRDRCPCWVTPISRLATKISLIHSPLRPVTVWHPSILCSSSFWIIRWFHRKPRKDAIWKAHHHQ